MKKPVLLLASLVLAGSALTACGGDDADSAPTNASKKEFCQGFLDMSADGAKLGSDPSASEMVDFAHDFADKMIEIGTPEDMPDEARKNYLAAMDKLKNVKESDVKGDKNPMEDVDDEGVSEYMQKACADEMKKSVEDSMGDAASDAADELSDAASDAADAASELASSVPSIDPDELESALGDLDPSALESQLDDALASATAAP